MKEHIFQLYSTTGFFRGFLINEQSNDSHASQKEQLISIKAQIEDIQSRLDALYEAIELKHFTLEDLKLRILRQKAALERLMASKDDLERQLNQDCMPEMAPDTL